MGKIDNGDGDKKLHSSFQAHSNFETKPIHVKLVMKNENYYHHHRQNQVMYKNDSGEMKLFPPTKISWEMNQMFNILNMDDQLLIQCFDKTRYEPHQLLGETYLGVGELVRQSHHLKCFTKGLPLRIPNEQLARRLLAYYPMNPCLLIKFDIL